MGASGKPRILVIEGPTAIGKSEIAVACAQRLGGEVISADAYQIYRRMNIGTGKVTPEEMKGIPHHLLDMAEPEDAYDVTRFLSDGRKAILDVLSRGAVPVICGGTGFYVQALVKDLPFSEGAPDEALRGELADYAEKNGAAALHERLARLDPAAAEKIHPNNIKRVIRAIEYAVTSGEKISEKNRTEKEMEGPYDPVVILLTMERDALYRRIERRVDVMLAAGLVDEVRSLAAEGLTDKDRSMQGLGYKEILWYLNGTISYEEAVRILKRDTRHFAKRQLTWFRADPRAVVIERDPSAADTERIADQIADLFRNSSEDTENV